MTSESKTALITGGASGIGAKSAGELLKKGLTVIVLDIRKSNFIEKMKENKKFYFYECDISNFTLVETCINQIHSKHGAIDILINSAGIMDGAPLVNIMSKDSHLLGKKIWDKVMAVNLHGVFFVTSLIVNEMVRKRVKGVIVNLSSVTANGNPGQAAYAASKAAIESLTKSWSKELGRLGVRFVCIAPGFCDTLATRNILDEKSLQNKIQTIPLRRLGEVDEIVQAINFSIENDYLTGSVISIDGGVVI